MLVFVGFNLLFQLLNFFVFGQDRVVGMRPAGKARSLLAPESRGVSLILEVKAFVHDSSVEEFKVFFTSHGFLRP